MRPCLDCGEPCTGPRCPEHTVDTKPTAQDRGYDHKWNLLSQRARRLQPWCTDCGSVDDLQTDHTPEAWARKAEGKAIRLNDVEVVCGPCNRARGTARGEAPRSRLPDPAARRNPRYTPLGGIA